MAARLAPAGFSLADHTDRGRPAGRYREFVAIPPYVIRYRVGTRGVEIIRIRHGAQRSD
jgi:toxin ParE1/3/4